MRCAAAAAVAVALVAVAASAAAAGEGAGTCARRDAPPFLDAIGSRCAFVRIEPSPPLEVGLLSSSHRLIGQSGRWPLAALFPSKSKYLLHVNTGISCDALFFFLIFKSPLGYDFRVIPGWRYW